MKNPDTSPQLLNWLPQSLQLVESIADLFEIYASEHDDVLDSDYRKLLNVAQKLEVFTEQCNSAANGGLAINASNTRHDLRNHLGAIMGYSQLIQEELQPPSSFIAHIDNILQLCQQLLEQDDTLFPTPAPTEELESATRPPATATGTILIVDDQAESREILRRYLQSDQHQVLEAGDGKHMFQVLQLQDVDLILLDLILPEMDGDELLHQLKKNPDLRAIPVIVVSGNKNTQRVIRCIEEGAEDYLFKPFNPTLLRARISAGVERKRWHDKEQQYRHELERNQRFIRKVFGRYLSEEIVATLLENPDGLDLGGVQRKVTILMADIRGFSTIAEQLPPQRVVRLLNNYLGTMSEIIMKYHGTVDEFIGDAILAIFGAPISREDDSDRAIRCALEMQHAMLDINSKNRMENLPEISMGISIHTGPVVAGNIGSEKRAKYGVVGHTVNQTARIEQHCAAGGILISEATLMDSRAMLSIGGSETIQAKGILKAINIYQLDSVAPAAEINALQHTD